MSMKAISSLDFVRWAVPTTTMTFAAKVIDDKSKIVVRSATVLEQLLEQL